MQQESFSELNLLNSSHPSRPKANQNLVSFPRPRLHILHGIRVYTLNCDVWIAMHSVNNDQTTAVPYVNDAAQKLTRTQVSTNPAPPKESSADSVVLCQGALGPRGAPFCCHPPRRFPLTKDPQGPPGTRKCGDLPGPALPLAARDSITLVSLHPIPGRGR